MHTFIVHVLFWIVLRIVLETKISGNFTAIDRKISFLCSSYIYWNKQGFASS